MNQISTTLEQSKKLLSLGIKPETADMYYFQNIDSDYFPPDKEWYSQVAVKDDRFNFKYDIPAWSLSALLELMPKPIKMNGNFAYPHVDLLNHSIDYFVGMALYKTIEGETLIDAAVEMIEWLVTNKHLKV